jgi:hypothetical protein
LLDTQEVTGSNPVSPTIIFGGNKMRPLQLALEVVREKSPKRRDEKMDIFLHSLLHTREGRKLRKIILPRIAKGIGLNDPLG